MRKIFILHEHALLTSNNVQLRSLRKVNNDDTSVAKEPVSVTEMELVVDNSEVAWSDELRYR